MNLFIATWNKHKSIWLREGLSPLNMQFMAPDHLGIDDVEETGANCSENALIKVRAIGVQIDSIIIGEDSGLFIHALDGFPGVQTTRWLKGNDDDRSIKLLEKLANIPDRDRGAHFESTVAALFPDGTEKIFTGMLQGMISRDLSGDPGKGYQRIFILPSGKSIAQSGSTIIQTGDHRYQAINQTVLNIRKWLDVNEIE